VKYVIPSLARLKLLTAVAWVMKYQLATILVVVAAVALAPSIAMSSANAHVHAKTITGVNVAHGGHIAGGMYGGKHNHTTHTHIHAVKGTKIVVHTKKGPTKVAAY